MKSQEIKSNLKPQQKNILLLLYKFRFLNRNQIQILLNHKYKNRVILWLNDLNQRKYIDRDFTRKFGATPAVYSLNKNSIKVLKSLDDVKPSLLNRLYKETKRTETFKQHCLFLADIFLSLTEFTKKHNLKLHFYTKTDLAYMQYLILPNPDAYFATEESELSIKRYFLDIFDPQIPRMALRKRVRQYFNYYLKGYWQHNTNKPFPEIIFICPDNVSKNYISKFIKPLLKEENENISFYLSTWDEIKHQGIKKETLNRII